MELQAITGQRYFGEDGPRGLDPIPGLLAQPAPAQAARGRQKDFLFVHLTLSGLPADNSMLTHDIVDAISALFYQTPGSVTAALKQAITQSNKQLLRYNVSGTATPREGALTCAVLRGEELFVVQTGESFALLGHDFGIERIPANPPDSITPFGRTAGLNLRYSHTWLQQGDMLLLADPRLAHLSTSAFEPALIDVDVEDGLQAMQGIIGEDSARVLLVEFADEAPAHVPDAMARRPNTVSRQLPPPTATPLRAGQQGTLASPEPGGGRSVPRMDVEVVETQARKATSKFAMALSGLAAWFANLLSVIYSPSDQQEESRNWLLPAALAVIIPIIVAVVVAVVYIQRGNVARMNELRTEMGQVLLQAQQAVDPSQAQALYGEVLSLASEAEELRPSDTDVTLFRNAAIKSLDELAGVARLQGLPLRSFGPEADLTSLAMGGEEDQALYILDNGSNRLLRDDLLVAADAESANEPEIILVGEQVVGSHVVGRLLDTMWRPKGINVERDGLAVLDGRGALITFYPNLKDVRAVPLGLASDWQLPSQTATFSERLYVLDAGAGVIWRYLPEGEGFIVSEGQQFIEFPEGADLTNVVDFAIVSRDGSVILLYGDGRMRQYGSDTLLWDENDLASAGLSSPMIAPVAVKIVGSGLNSSVFVADPGSDRVLQFSMGGTFLAQYKASDENGLELFRRTSDITVLENPLRIYAAADDTVYLVSQE